MVLEKLMYQEARHGNHEAPDFTRDDGAFWAAMTTNRRALSVRAHRLSSSTVEEASDA